MQRALAWGWRFGNASTGRSSGPSAAEDQGGDGTPRFARFQLAALALAHRWVRQACRPTFCGKGQSGRIMANDLFRVVSEARWRRGLLRVQPVAFRTLGRLRFFRAACGHARSRFRTGAGLHNAPWKQFRPIRCSNPGRQFAQRTMRHEFDLRAGRRERYQKLLGVEAYNGSAGFSRCSLLHRAA